MDVQSLKILHLNKVGRGGHPTLINFPSLDFEDTLEAVKRHERVAALAKSPNRVRVEWTPLKPDIMSVKEYGDGNDLYAIDIPVEGEVADAFMADLRQMARVKIVQEMRAEEEQRLLEQADVRLECQLTNVHVMAENNRQ
jgi:hypothetical protein